MDSADKDYSPQQGKRVFSSPSERKERGNAFFYNNRVVFGTSASKTGFWVSADQKSEGIIGVPDTREQRRRL